MKQAHRNYRWSEEIMLAMALTEKVRFSKRKKEAFKNRRMNH
jgi:hypothetical protein